MILLVGSDEDHTMVFFKQFLIDQGSSYLFLNQKLLFNDRIKLFSDYFSIDNKKYFYSDISGVLNRMSTVDQQDTCNDLRKTLSRTHIFINYLMNYKLQNVLNCNFHSISNDSKLLQLHLITQVLKYIKIPDYAVIKGYNIREVLYGNSSHDKHIIKSLSSIRSIVKDYESNLEIFHLKKSSEPVLFQQFLEGVNIRVHTIGNVHFAIKIISDTIDYRYESTIQEFHQIDIPKNIGDECLSVAKCLNLRFAGIDLLLTKENHYYILEVNPSPGYSYFEEKINNRSMSEQLMRVLSNGK